MTATRPTRTPASTTTMTTKTTKTIETTKTTIVLEIRQKEVDIFGAWVERLRH